jgi:regulator of sigma E protease
MVIAIIIFIFLGLIITHEMGHFLAAKRNGVEVEEFGIGFPPRLWGKKFRGTLYSINLLPLGGFVSLKGEMGDGGKGSLGGATLWQKTKIMLAGVGMNALAAFLIFYGLCVTGLPAIGAPFEPNFLPHTYSQRPEVIITQVVGGSPADKAGLKRNDYILSADGMAFESVDDLRSFTKSNQGNIVVFSVVSAGEGADTEHPVALKLNKTKDGSGALGVGGQQTYKIAYNPVVAVAAAAYITAAFIVATIVGIVQLLINIPVLILGLFATQIPTAAEAASGPIGIIYIISSIGSLGWSYVWLFMANIAVALAAFNFLPLPALDGGRLAFDVFKKVTGRRISEKAESLYHGIGFAALLALVALISVYDVKKYFIH